MGLKNFTFLKNKKVLITGNTGFKGSWLSLWLNSLGAEVFGLSLKMDISPSLFDALELENKTNKIKYQNICDYQEVKNFILDVQPDIIFHFAAQPIVKVSYDDPISTFNTNVIGTMNVLDSLRFLDKKCSVIIVTTDKVYENKEWIYPYRENDRLGGHDPYSSSKVCAEVITNSYYRSFFHPDNYSDHRKKIAVARAGNVIGGGDWSENRVIPDLIRAILSNDKLVLRSPESIRPWQHVLESLSGYLRLSEFLELNNPREEFYSFNFGPFATDIMTVGELAEFAIEVYGKGEIIIDNLNKFHETNYLSLDSSKAIRILSWKPVYSTKISVVETIVWYKEYNQNLNNIYNYSLNQIINYDAKITAQV